MISDKILPGSKNRNHFEEEILRINVYISWALSLTLVVQSCQSSKPKNTEEAIHSSKKNTIKTSKKSSENKSSTILKEEPYYSISQMKINQNKGHFKEGFDNYAVALKMTDGKVSDKILTDFWRLLSSWPSTEKDQLNGLIFNLQKAVQSSTDAKEYRIFKKANISEEKNLFSWLQEKFSSFKSKAKSNGKAVFLWNSRGWKNTDPFLNNLLGLACKHPEKTKDAAQKAIPPLTWEYKEFLDIYLHYCGKKFNLAENKLKSLIFKLGELEDANRNLFLKSASLLVKLNRVNGSSREDLANSYFFEMLAYNNLSEKDIPKNVDRTEFLTKKADIAIWAGRYRALVGDYFHGEFFLAQAKSILAKLSLVKNLTADQKEEIINLTAEAYHVLAFRINIEKNKLDEAIKLTDEAIKIPDISASWLQTFGWYKGLYYYLKKDSANAIVNWEKLLISYPNTKYKSALYFWLQRSYLQENNKYLSNHYSRLLQKEFPLSYYSLVAPCLLDNKDKCDPKKNSHLKTISFGGDLKNQNNEITSIYQKDPKIWPGILSAKQFIKYKQIELAKISLNEVLAKAKKRYPLAPHAGLYREIQKLFIMSGSYISAIRIGHWLLSDQEMKHNISAAELKNSYPTPFENIYNKQGQTLGSNGTAILYAISRQESGFIIDAESPAGAVGLMQIIPPLAKKLLNLPDLSYMEMAEKLKSPERNVTLGALNLKMLFARFDGNFAAVSGSYNAGEYLVDIWLKRRKNEDLLTWIELVPFLETRNYIKNTWRNLEMYKYLASLKNKPISEAKENKDGK